MGIPEYTPAQDKLVVRRIDALVREEEYYLDHRDEPFALSAAESARNLASALEALRAELATERSSRERAERALEILCGKPATETIRVLEENDALQAEYGSPQPIQSSPSPTLELKPQTPTTGINAVIGQMPELASPSEPLAWLILTCHGTRWAVDLSEMDAEQRCRRLNASDSGAYQHCKPFRVVLLVQLENA